MFRSNKDVGDVGNGSCGLPWKDIGLGYVRFSDEGSNPRSLDQQRINVLQRARRDGVFIPWCYVCADYAVRGTLACRRGDKFAKMLVDWRVATGVTWFIIDGAVPKTVSTQILDDGMIVALTAEVNTRLEEAARRPHDPEQKITSRQRQVARLTERLEKIENTGGRDNVFDKMAELNRQLEATSRRPAGHGEAPHAGRRQAASVDRPAG